MTAVLATAPARVDGADGAVTSSTQRLSGIQTIVGGVRHATCP